MMVIDQHALHERILYEELRSRVAQGQVESQRLLVPEPVDLPRRRGGRGARTNRAARAARPGGRAVRRRHGAGAKHPGDAAARRARAAGPRPGRAPAHPAPAADPRRPAGRAAAHGRVQGGRQGRPAAFTAGDRRPCSSAGTWSPTRITARTAGRRRWSSPRPTWKSSSGGSERSMAAAQAEIAPFHAIRAALSYNRHEARATGRSRRSGRGDEWGVPVLGASADDDLRDDRAGPAFFAGRGMEAGGRGRRRAGRAADRLPAPRAGPEADPQGSAHAAGLHDPPRRRRRPLARQRGEAPAAPPRGDRRWASITSTSRWTSPPRSAGSARPSGSSATTT